MELKNDSNNDIYIQVGAKAPHNRVLGKGSANAKASQRHGGHELELQSISID